MRTNVYDRESETVTSTNFNVLPQPIMQQPEGFNKKQHFLLQLQRKFGNRHVQRVLTLSQKANREKEAPQIIANAIHGARHWGQVLPSGDRTKMESAFGIDLRGVRVHTDNRADVLSHFLGARAFTVGQDIFFRRGAYNPSSLSGRELLVHELTHVVQQAPWVSGKLTISNSDDDDEREADQIAERVIREPGLTTNERVIVKGKAKTNRIQCKGFGDYFQDCMKSMGLPAPTSLFSSYTTAVATIASITAAVSKFGTSVTIAELVGACILSEYLLAAGAVGASFYAGACVGCLSSALGQSLSGGLSLGDVLYELLGPEPGLWIADVLGL
jgi:hypothetical protein